MNRLDLYKGLLKNILVKYSGLSSETDDYEDINDYLDNDNIEQALSLLNSTATLKQGLSPLLLSIKKYLDDGSIVLSDIITNMGKIKTFLHHSDSKYSRPLSFFSNNLNIVETSTLYLSNSETYSLECLILLESILLDNNKQKSLLKDLCNRENGHTYIVQMNKARLGLDKNDAKNFDNLYAYALASSMNQKKAIMIPEVLQFSWDTAPVLTVFEYNKNITYQEYYDIYDVFNDWLHATDILTAFIKMYQITEYMIYRSQMAEIVNRANIKQSFLRETKSLSSKFTKSERDTIIKIFPKLFNQFSLDSNEVRNSWSFVDKYYGMTQSGNHYLDTTNSQQDIDKGVARFIYDTRCAIVHNKESEFHILYNNYEEYQSIVPLMKSINNIMAKKILTILNTDSPIIHYQHKKLDLY